MKNTKLFSLGVVAMAALLTFSGCGGNKSSASGNEDADHSVVMVTDVSGVDDKSFNQSAWEGLQRWGKEQKLKRGVGGYDYIQSNEIAQFASNIDTAASNGFKTVFGIGYLLADSIEAAAGQNPETNFVIIDTVIEGKNNVVSATFRDNEVGYIAGVSAAYTTKTNKVGFIGGEEGKVIDRYEAGFTKGVKDTAKKMNKDISVDVKYAASFGDPAKGKALAANIYQNGSDIIYQAAGGTGAGVFSEAKALNQEKSEADKVWVLGVDRDQQDEGNYKSKDGKESNFCLASTIKSVGVVVQDISTRALKDKFPGGKHLSFGLKDGGVAMTDGYLSDEAKTAVKEAKDQIIAGDVKVPETPED
ncbi:BMP family lipoprotein [Enterococcus malodoratus]|uniref:BMP family lipoprotein n=1 Tax=Enterococcus malodoratus TaxID=71451 RepID=UPI003FD69C57